MSQTSGSYGKRASVFSHPRPSANPTDLSQHWDNILEKNPGIRHLIRPDYQHNYYDPPHDETTAKFLDKLNWTFPIQRHNLLRRFLPEQLYQYKALIAKLPYCQLQQLREQLYIGRIGDLGTNAPCTYTRRHWVYRLANGNETVTSETIKQLPTAELMRWYKTALNNIFADCAEEEYLRYKFCTGNRMPLVEKASLHNPLHYDPSDAYHIPNSFPPKACEALLPMVHDTHRYFLKMINEDCGRHFQPFFNALVHNRDLNESLITYEKIQRCAIGREIRARVMTNPPTFAGAYQIFGRTLSANLPVSFQKFFVNWLSIRSNPLTQFRERDPDILPIFNNQNVPAIKPLLDELRQELVHEGRLAPQLPTSFETPHRYVPTNQTQASIEHYQALLQQPQDLHVIPKHNNQQQLSSLTTPSTFNSIQNDVLQQNNQLQSGGIIVFLDPSSNNDSNTISPITAGYIHLPPHVNQ